MRSLLAVAWVLAACVPDPDPAITDSSPVTSAHVSGQGGLTLSRLGRHVGIATGFNNRRIGEDSDWSLTHPKPFAHDVATLNPRLVRFPGGTIGNYYDWDGATGAVPGTLYAAGTQCPAPVDPDQTVWQPVQPMITETAAHADTLDALKAEVPAGTSVVFMLNVLMRTKYNQRDLLSAAASKGFTIDRVELGNEYYESGPSVRPGSSCNVFEHAFPTGGHYAEVANAWAKTITATFPNAMIGVVANERTVDPSKCPGAGRWLCWNHDLLAQGLDADVHALVLHPYVYAGRDPTCAAGGSMYDDTDSFIGAGWQYASDLLDPNTGDTSSKGLFERALGGWQGAIWITEFGYRNYKSYDRTWGGGLATLAYTMRLLAEPRITLLLHHNITDAVWDRGDGLLDVANGTSGLTARGRALSLLDDAIDEAQPTTNDDVWRIDFADSVQYQLHAKCGYDVHVGAFDYPALIGRWFTHDYDQRGARGSSALIVNLGAKAVELDLASLFTAAGATAELWSAAATDETDDVVKPPVHTTIALDGQHHEVRVPPRGILRIHDASGLD